MLGKTLGDLYDYSCLHYSHKIAIISSKTRYTFSELKQKGTRLANALQNLGLKKGDRIAQLMPNCPEVLFTDYACCKTGLVRIPLATYLKLKDMIFILQETQARALIYDRSFEDVVNPFKPELPSLQYPIRLSNDHSAIPQGEYDFQSLLAEGSSEDVHSEVLEDDLARISYTGGTTGIPKGVIHSHRTLVASVIMELLDFGIGPDEVFLTAAPLTHGTGTLMLPFFLRGGSCVIVQGFHATQFLEWVEKEKVTSSFIVPTIIYALIDHPNVEQYDTRSLRNLIYGAAPIAPARLKRAIQIFGKVFTQLYGQAEAPMALAALPREEHIIEGDETAQKRLASCGRPTLLTRLRLLDGDGNEVGPGQPGEIVVKSPNIMVGYLNRPELTAETIKDGWLYTGDIAYQDEQGYLFIVDRKKDMIVSGGFNIFPKEIEDTLYEHPAVAMAAVIGVPDPKWGEAVKAIVVRKPGQSVSGDDLIQFCKEKKGTILVPKSIDFINEIPLTPLGKPNKVVLRQKYWKDQTRKVG